MSDSGLVILLARQRSGTNALRSILDAHPAICCLPEVFHVGARDSKIDLWRETNFFNFIDRYARGSARAVDPNRHERLFVDYLEYLRCFSPKQYIVIDVKYNTTHLLTKPWADDITSPFFFDLVRQHGLRVLRLTRRNYLRYLVSWLKSLGSNRYHSIVGDSAHTDRTIHVDTNMMLRQMAKCHAEDQLVDRHVATYQNSFSCDYAELFGGPDGGMNPRVLEAVADWLRIDNHFPAPSRYERMASLPLSQTIENFDEVVSSLRGTMFEYCLEDEPAFVATARSTRDKPLAREQVDDTVETPTAVAAGSVDANVVSDDYYAARPEWLQGYVGHLDARFLVRAVIESRVSRVVEIGTASGFSTGLLCRALQASHQAGAIGADFEVVSYDAIERFYADPSRAVGDATREQLPAGLLKHVTFRHPAVAWDVQRDFERQSIDFLFIDANHGHPWPALDLYAVVDVLSPGAVVLLHDVNLPLIFDIPDWGAKYLFDDLDVQKDTPADGELPNIGRLIIPSDKSRLKRQLQQIVFAHEWQVDPRDYAPDYLERLGISAPSAASPMQR